MCKNQYAQGPLHLLRVTNGPGGEAKKRRRKITGRINKYSVGAKACPWALTLVTLVKVTAVVTVAMLAGHMAFYAGYAGYAGDVCSLRALLLYFFAFNTSLPLFLTYDSFFHATLLSIAIFCEYRSF